MKTLQKIMDPQVKLKNWKLADENIKKLSKKKQENIAFIIKYKKRARKLRLIFLGLIPSIIVFLYLISFFVVLGLGISLSIFLFATIYSLIPIVFIWMVAYVISTEKLFKWETWRRPLWKLAEEQNLMKLYVRCEFQGRSPWFPFRIQYKLNRMIYCHFHEYVPTKSDLRRRPFDMQFDDTRRTNEIHGWK